MKTKMDYHEEAARKADELIRTYHLTLAVRSDLLSVFKTMGISVSIVPTVEFNYFTTEGTVEIPNKPFLDSPCNRVDVVYKWAARFAPKNVIPAWYYGIQMAFAYEFLMPQNEVRAYLKERPHASVADIAMYFNVSKLFAAERLDKYEEEVSV